MSGCMSLSAIKNTKVYQNFLEERDHILKNKWYMSEKEGQDVGFERALLDWSFNHRNKWKKATN